MIRKLPQQTSEFIKSQQYIQNTFTIVKELVENSLDAKSTLIKIFIDDEIIKVDDNGLGIQDLSEIGEAGATSKESTTFYVLGLNSKSSNLSCGYRGLALCSIKNMCNLEIISRHESNSLAFKKNFSSNEISACPRERGTTVNITKIFDDCPIRKKLNKKNNSKYLKNVVSLIDGYSKIYKADFIVKYKGKVITNKKGNNSLEEFCEKTRQDDSLLSINMKYLLFIQKAKDNEESFIFADKRLVTSKRIIKEIRNTYNLFENGTPVFFLQLKTLTDFNISPSKSEILLENEDDIINKIKEDIRQHFSNQIVTSNRIESKLEKNDTNSWCNKQNEEMSKKIKISDGGNTQEVLDNFMNENIQRQHESSQDSQLNTISLDNQSQYCKDEMYENSGSSNEKSGNLNEKSIDLIENRENHNNFDEICKNSENLNEYIQNSSNLNENSGSTNENSENDIIVNSISENIINLTDKKNFIVDTPISSHFKDSNFEILKQKILKNNEFDVKDTIVDQIIEERKLILEETVFDYIKPQKHENIILKLDKTNFCEMEIIGQFNKGFILTKLLKDNKSYLLLIDQHAADEIYNYENLLFTTKFIKQKLIIPIDLNLSPIDILYIEKNMKIFNDYGFIIENNKLVTLPMFKDQIFGVEDFKDLLENVKNDEYELDKIHKILASKACRKSIMIGDGLNKKEMEKIVKNLGSLNKPWKCPHGRPTLMVIDVIS